jgi:hypothetical protein
LTAPVFVITHGNPALPCGIRQTGPERISLQKLGTQQPGRLYRHTDSFTDDGMGLTGRVPNTKKILVPAQADARIYRPGGEPGAVSMRASKRFCNAAALLLEQGSRIQQASVKISLEVCTMPP